MKLNKGKLYIYIHSIQKYKVLDKTINFDNFVKVFFLFPLFVLIHINIHSVDTYIYYLFILKNNNNNIPLLQGRLKDFSKGGCIL